MRKIPLVDLWAQNRKLQGKINKSISRISKTSRFILGDDVSKFEKEFARFCKARFCVGTGSGTAALHVALVALGIGKGDEVITVPNTFIATAEAITHTGAKVVFCDIGTRTHVIDPKSFELHITQRTKAVIPVHIYGNPCKLDDLVAIARKHNIFIIEDAAQAHGAQFQGKRVGTWGDIGTFSFFPAKNLGSWGDAGAVVTNDKRLYKKINTLVNHGSKEKYNHFVVGFNYRLDSIQAAILRIKLPFLEKWNEMRRQNAMLYRHFFKKNHLVECLQETPKGYSVYHLFVICHPFRDKLREYLRSKGVETGIHYPIPLHLQPAYKNLGYKNGDFPIAEEKAKQILSLPMYPELTKAKIKRIVSYIKEYKQ